MPEQFKSNAGGLMAGHADKWSDKNRRPNSHNAGAGRAGSRNQGTGAAGKANTVASDAVDTTKMSPDEKLKYFNSLGLLKPQQAQPAAPQASEQQKTYPSTPKAENPVKALSDRLGKVFSTKPEMLQDVVKHLQGLAPQDLKKKAIDLLNVMKDNNSTDPMQVHGAIMTVLNDSGDVDFDEVETSAQPASDDWSKHYLMPKPERDWYNSDGDYKAAINQAKAIGKNKQAYNIAMTAAEDGARDWEDGYNPKGYKTKNDMVNAYIDAYWDEIEAVLNNNN